VIIHIPHNKDAAVSLKGHTVFKVNISFKNSGRAFHLMAPQPGMAKIGIQQSQAFFHILLYCRRQLLIPPDEPVRVFKGLYISHFNSLSPYLPVS
jgi:hypothetical protein